MPQLPPALALFRDGSREVARQQLVDVEVRARELLLEHGEEALHRGFLHLHGVGGDGGDDLGDTYRT